MRNMAPSDNGNYSCVVSNENGQISHYYEVDVMSEFSFAIPWFSD